jgi:predicted kinase
VARGKRFFSLAENFARQTAPPMLLLVCGMMGTGKSSLARAVAARTGALIFASDHIRKELAARELGSLKARDTRKAPYGAGIYTNGWNRRTYDAMFARAEAALRAGHSVVLDATFARRAERETAFALASGLGARAFLVECRLPDSTALARLTRRERQERSISDGRAELYPSQKAVFEPTTELSARQRIVVDTRRPVQALARQVCQRTSFSGPPSLFALPPKDSPKR